MKKNSFGTVFAWIFWLSILGFLGYRSVLLTPADRNKVYVVYTKFNGFQDKILQASQYYIHWQNLLPGNVELFPIPSNPRQIYLSKSSLLPSASNYQLLLPPDNWDGSTSPSDASKEAALQNPFRYLLEINISYQMKEDKLLDFVQDPANTSAFAAAQRQGDPENQENQEEPENYRALLRGTDSWIQQLEARIKQRLGQELESIFDEQKAMENAFAVQKYLSAVLQKGFPEINLISLDVSRYQQPDLELYAKVKKNYQNLLQQLSSQSLENILEKQSSRISQELQLQNIERLGKILEQYPVLIQYFAITQEQVLAPRTPRTKQGEVLNAVRENILQRVAKTTEP